MASKITFNKISPHFTQIRESGRYIGKIETKQNGDRVIRDAYNNKYAEYDKSLNTYRKY